MTLLKKLQIYFRIYPVVVGIANGNVAVGCDGRRLVLKTLALRNWGLKIQRWRVRQCFREIDPVGTVLRWQQVIQRRSYHVRSPNFLLHLDGNHKMVKWRFVIHAAIDGFPRVILYVYCATDNTSLTVQSLFEEAVRQYGLELDVTMG